MTTLVSAFRELSKGLPGYSRKGLRALCSLFLLLSLSGALGLADAQTLFWPLRDSCNDGDDIRLMFFEPDYNNGYNKSWPSSGDGYLLRDGTRGLYRLNNCTPRATVCYGAEEDARKDGHWGAYLDGCDEIGDWSCCKTCPASGVREVGTTNLICPGGDSGDVGNGSDGFRSRVRLSDASGRAVGSNVGASKEIGEPNHAGNRGGHSVWWTWTAPASGTFVFDTRGSDFDTLLAVYTGSSVSRLSRVASNDDIGGGVRQSEVSVTAQQGQTYHIAVDGYGVPQAISCCIGR